MNEEVMKNKTPSINKHLTFIVCETIYKTNLKAKVLPQNFLKILF